jgi:hypothetical protein
MEATKKLRMLLEGKGTEAYSESRAHPVNRAHASGFSGYWIHPIKGSFPLSSADHHKDFLLENPELFGITGGLDLEGVYRRGWISIRKWSGSMDKWAVVYFSIRSSRKTIEEWATKLYFSEPSERSSEIQFHSFRDDVDPSTMRIQDIVQGKLGESLEQVDQITGI